MDVKIFEYYFNTFFKGTHEYLRACLIVSLKDPLTPLKTPKAYYLNGNDLNFEITPFGISEGFQKDNIDHIVFLGTEWLRITHLIFFFHAYEDRLSYLNKTILFFRVLSWLAISYMYFLNPNVLLNWKFLVFIRSFHSSKPLLAPPPPREAYQIKEKAQKQLEKDTQGAYKKGHLAMLDEEKRNEHGHVSFEGGLTHGKGSSENPSYEINPEKDLQGNNRPQSATFPKKPIYIEPDFIAKKVETNNYLEQPRVKENIDKHSKYNEKDKAPENTEK